MDFTLKMNVLGVIRRKLNSASGQLGLPFMVVSVLGFSALLGLAKRKMHNGSTANLANLYCPFRFGFFDFISLGFRLSVIFNLAILFFPSFHGNRIAVLEKQFHLVPVTKEIILDNNCEQDGNKIL